jgi:hypothetical protein
MSKLINQLARTDHRIRKQTQRIDLYRNRVARRSKNPALAEQANAMLPAMCVELVELGRYRKRLMHALEVEAFLSPKAANGPDRHPRIPRYAR